MKKKQLQSLLQDVEDFNKPVQNLEQYITGPYLAAGIVLEVRAALLPSFMTGTQDDHQVTCR